MSNTAFIIIGVVKVAVSATFETVGKSNGTVSWAFIFNALAADSAA